jgi:hypothetical protein
MGTGVAVGVVALAATAVAVSVGGTGVKVAVGRPIVGNGVLLGVAVTRMMAATAVGACG